MIPDSILPPELVKFMQHELGARPSDEEAMILYLQWQRAKDEAAKAEDLFQQCFRHDMARQVAFNTWMAAKEQK